MMCIYLLLAAIIAIPISCMEQPITEALTTLAQQFKNLEIEIQLSKKSVEIEQREQQKLLQQEQEALKKKQEEEKRLAEEQLLKQQQEQEISKKKEETEKKVLCSPTALYIPKLSAAEIEKIKKVQNTKTALFLENYAEAIAYIKNEYSKSNNNLFLLLNNIKNKFIDEGYTENAATYLDNDPEIDDLFKSRYGPEWRGDRFVLQYKLQYVADKKTDVGWKVITLFSDRMKQAQLKFLKENTRESEKNFNDDMAEIINQYSADRYEKAGYTIEDNKKRVVPS